MSGRIAVIYVGDLAVLATAFGEAAGHVASEVQVVRLEEDRDCPGDKQHDAYLRYLEWADGIAFGTPSSDGAPDPALMQFIKDSEPLWRTGRLYDKAVTVFTDEPELMAPDSILHPLYDALYRWGAVIVGPRDVDLGWEGTAHQPSAAGSLLSPARLRAAQYRAHRLSRLTSVLAEDRFRRARLQL